MSIEQLQIKPLEQAIYDLHVGSKIGEIKLLDTQIDDFNREAKKLDPDFAKNLPTRGISGGGFGINGDFKFLDHSLKNKFIDQYWGSFYIPHGVEEVGQLNGLGYQAKMEGFMLICKPYKEISRANLLAVLVPRHYEILIDSLRETYPDVKFITVDEIKDLPKIVEEEI